MAPYGTELSRSPEDDQDRVGIQARVRSGVRDEPATRGPYGQHQRPGRQPKRCIGQAPTDQRRGASDRAARSPVRQPADTLRQLRLDRRLASILLDWQVALQS
jgi:hypothetical protein